MDTVFLTKGYSLWQKKISLSQFNLVSIYSTIAALTLYSEKSPVSFSNVWCGSLEALSKFANCSSNYDQKSYFTVLHKQGDGVGVLSSKPPVPENEAAHNFRSDQSKRWRVWKRWTETEAARVHQWPLAELSHNLHQRKRWRLLGRQRMQRRKRKGSNTENGKRVKSSKKPGWKIETKRVVETERANMSKGLGSTKTWLE